MRTFFLCILNISVVSWDDHHLDFIKKLSLALDKKFEYEFSIMGFENMVKRWLKTNINKLKIRFLERRTKCPINIVHTHWEKLKVY